jgi:acyl phosphate:glycerol-3-phosphate acyltransferase
VSAAVAVLAAYLLGALSPASVVARLRGVDLRAVGSGNPGATNVGRALGRRWGVAVGVLDVAKGYLPAALASLLVSHEVGLASGIAAVLGHVTSPYLRGRGGKGVATAGGAVLGSHPWWGLVVVGVWVAVLAASRWVALASCLAAVAVLVCALVEPSAGWDVAWAAVLAVVVVARHRRNLVRGSTDRRGAR